MLVLPSENRNYASDEEISWNAACFLVGRMRSLNQQISGPEIC